MNVKVIFPDGREQLAHIIGESEDGRVITTSFGTFVRNKKSWVHQFVRDPKIVAVKIPLKEARELYKDWKRRN